MNANLYIQSSIENDSLVSESEYLHQSLGKVSESAFFNSELLYFILYQEVQNEISTLSASFISAYSSYLNIFSSITESKIIDIDLLKKIFIIGNTDELATIIDINENFTQLLFNCRIEIIKRFGTVIPKLEVITDAEDETWKTIFVTIPDQDNFLLAMDKLEDIINTWFANQPKDFRKAVTINLI